MREYEFGTLGDVLAGRQNVDTIMVRCNSPDPDEEDMLFGYCSLQDGKLVSLDGDNYYLSETITEYHWESENDLIVWIEVGWSSGYWNPKEEKV